MSPPLTESGAGSPAVPLNHKDYSNINGWLVFLICHELAFLEAIALAAWADSSEASKYSAQRYNIFHPGRP
jgi:hypothetical protein